MTSKEFLSMQRSLDFKIETNIHEVSRLREMTMHLSSVSTGEKVSGGQHTDAPFTHLIDKIVDLEREIDSEIDSLVSVRNDIHAAIDAIGDHRLQAVLQYRYLQNMSFQEITNTLYAERTSVYRWHKQALEQISVPKKYDDS